jgi:hypothetical protein
MPFTQTSFAARKRRIVLSLCFAAGLAVAALGAAGRGEAAGLTVPAFAARDGIVLAQATTGSDKGAKSEKSQKQARKPKRRAVRCGGPGLPECP